MKPWQRFCRQSANSGTAMMFPQPVCEIKDNSHSKNYFTVNQSDLILNQNHQPNDLNQASN